MRAAVGIDWPLRFSRTTRRVVALRVLQSTVLALEAHALPQLRGLLDVLVRCSADHDPQVVGGAIQLAHVVGAVVPPTRDAPSYVSFFFRQLPPGTTSSATDDADADSDQHVNGANTATREVEVVNIGTHITVTAARLADADRAAQIAAENAVAAGDVALRRAKGSSADLPTGASSTVPCPQLVGVADPSRARDAALTLFSTSAATATKAAMARALAELLYASGAQTEAALLCDTAAVLRSGLLTGPAESPEVLVAVLRVAATVAALLRERRGMNTSSPAPAGGSVNDDDFEEAVYCLFFCAIQLASPAAFGARATAALAAAVAADAAAGRPAHMPTVVSAMSQPTVFAPRSLSSRLIPIADPTDAVAAAKLVSNWAFQTAQLISTLAYGTPAAAFARFFARAFRDVLTVSEATANAFSTGGGAAVASASLRTVAAVQTLLGATCPTSPAFPESVVTDSGPLYLPADAMADALAAIQSLCAVPLGPVLAGPGAMTALADGTTSSSNSGVADNQSGKRSVVSTVTGSVE